MTEKEIIASATKQFYKIGLKLTMQDVAADLHIAKKTIYQFYASKEDLLIGMLDFGFGAIQEQKRQILAEKIPYKEKVRKVMTVKDSNENRAIYVQLPVEIETTGPIELVGPKVVVLEGGMSGTYIRTTGETGEASITFRSAQTEPVTIKLQIKGRNEK